MARLLRFIGHELMTPVYSVVESLRYVLENSNLDKQIQEYLETGFIQAKQLNYLNLNLIDYSALVTNQFSINQQKCFLSVLISECEEIIYSLCQRKGVSLKIKVSNNVPVEIWVDANRLQQVLLTLLGNSIKYTKAGYVILTVQQSYYGFVNFSIIDSGSGIQLDNIYFDQVNIAENPTSFGLDVSNRLLIAMNATKLTIHTIEGKGTNIYFDIPVSPNQSMNDFSQDRVHSPG